MNRARKATITLFAYGGGMGLLIYGVIVLNGIAFISGMVISTFSVMVVLPFVMIRKRPIRPDPEETEP
jgi:hypothetical protein